MQTTAQLQYTATLLADAQIRSSRPDHHGNSVPVVCIHAQLHNAAKTHIRAEKRFGAGQHDQAEQAANSYSKGKTIVLSCPVEDMSLFAGNTSSIQIINDHPKDKK